jgi:hypothetical protein
MLGMACMMQPPKRSAASEHFAGFALDCAVFGGIGLLVERSRRRKHPAPTRSISQRARTWARALNAAGIGIVATSVIPLYASELWNGTVRRPVPMATFMVVWIGFLCTCVAAVVSASDEIGAAPDPTAPPPPPEPG